MQKPIAIVVAAAPPKAKQTNYPEPFALRMKGRLKHPLGDLFGLKDFGVNLTRLAPKAVSALHHRHSHQEEFVYVLEGEPTLVSDDGEVTLRPGMAAGFAAGGAAHHLENRTDADCVILEIGTRTQGDDVAYPQDDIKAVMGSDGAWTFARKNGESY